MTTRMPDLTTTRLIIREFRLDDLEDAHRILDVELAEAQLGTEGAMTRSGRQRWLEWSVLNYEYLGWLFQPPYGDRAVTLRDSGELIGASGLAPTFCDFSLFPAFNPDGRRPLGLLSPEVGLYYALSPRFRGSGYATEAAQGLVEYAFNAMQLKKIVATTAFDNGPSMAVMHRLGMRVEHNPYPEPDWIQVVGVLENPRAAG